MGVTVTFIAILELMREGLIEIVQAEVYQPIHVRPAGAGRLTVVAGMDGDAENWAGLAQPAYPDENEDPDDEASDAPSAVEDSVTLAPPADDTQT